MRHPILLQLTLATLLLGSFQLQAGQDYPAAGFEPQVIFQDSELIESTGPLPVAMPTTEEPYAAPTSGRNLSGHVQPSGTITDSSPPYGMLLLALGMIGLPFWLSLRAEKEGSSAESGTESTGQVPVEAEEETEQSQQSLAEEGESDPLHELAEEVEATMATSNRQRANKTKRARRR